MPALASSGVNSAVSLLLFTLTTHCGIFDSFHTFSMKAHAGLVVTSALRGFQMLLAIVVLGLSVNLIKDHNNHVLTNDYDYTYSPAPTVLSISAAIGGVTLVAVALNLVVAWTGCLREYIELLVDVILVVANLIGGIVSA